jgi:hypothetical protein
LTTKVCRKCGEEKPIGEFSPNKRATDGAQPRCKPCMAEYIRRWRAAHPDREDLEKARARKTRWRTNNREYHNSVSARWARRNPDKVAANWISRERCKQQARVAWADPEKIKAIYSEAALATKIFEVPYHVDHIVPLKGENVCGLHWEDNLRVLLGTKNLSKKNKLLPEHAAC